MGNLQSSFRGGGLVVFNCPECKAYKTFRMVKYVHAVYTTPKRDCYGLFECSACGFEERIG